LNGTTSNYSYDSLYELTQVTQGGSTTESYSYDPVGNRLSSMGTPSYSYNSSNELTANSTGSYTYDANGNTLSDAAGRSYTWDFENRLTQVVNPGVGTTTFRYDPFGRRIQKSGPLGTTNYLYDGMNLLLEVDTRGNLLARYNQGSDIDDHLSQSRSGATSYYDQDAIDSVTSLSDPAAGLANTYIYDSFGNMTASNNSIANPFRYTGREFDIETGIYNNRARYYDPSVGRFISEDPLRWFGSGANFFSYVNSNPTNYRDPSGQVKVHGNWCGPDWTGGREEEYTPMHDYLYKKPVDQVDEQCKRHDVCYYECRRDHPCDKGARRSCMRQCDYELVAHTAGNSFWGQVVPAGIIVDSLWPVSTGSNEHCGCKDQAPLQPPENVQTNHGPVPIEF
jgi:RHS repeat-associated protein